MTPQEALKLLDDAVSHISANRAVHDQIKEAISILQKELKDGDTNN